MKGIFELCISKIKIQDTKTVEIEPRTAETHRLAGFLFKLNHSVQPTNWGGST